MYRALQVLVKPRERTEHPVTQESLVRGHRQHVTVKHRTCLSILTHAGITLDELVHLAEQRQARCNSPTLGSTVLGSICVSLSGGPGSAGAG